MFFADDTLIFLTATHENCRRLIQLIDHYCLASRQQVNKLKYGAFFGGNVPEVLSQELSAILGVGKVGDPGSYLGVPAIWGRSKKCGLAYVKGRLLGKLQGEVLIKAVAQAIPTCPMNLFKFTITFCHELDSLISQFWWGQKGSENRIHWVSKERLCRSKSDDWLGFRNFEKFKDALLAKQCWRLITEPNTLWSTILKARYFPNCSFLEAKRGRRASWLWSSLLVRRDILLRGAHWQIRNGREVFFEISNSIGTFLHATQVTISRTTAPPLSVVLVTWTPPSPGFIKLNVDASWEASLGLGFVGVVAQNNAGGFLGAGRYSLCKTRLPRAGGKLSLFFSSVFAWEILSMFVASLGFQDQLTRLRTFWRRDDVRR
ncbi:ribonuclease H protein [Pyrus ussuriensis x Pyrus communis]|uniref:Ribonuclease H protein n=1 Tax=Pyrus ussuriensis x Pyrus communis TaxID=2448454 RepID=A0A5N5FIU4_9ROSA|nr:ribonuclease H protein [Pyrus ussuriensis x Pyrus communis]